MNIVLKIEGMTCGGCKGAVERVLKAQRGVSSVSVDLDAGRASVASVDGTDPQALAQAVSGAGYEARVEG